MNDDREELCGWKDIAAYMNRSVSAVMRLYRLPTDALPIVKDRLGRPRVMKSALDAWKRRECLPGPVYDELQRLRRDAKRSKSERPPCKCRKS